MSSDPFNYLWNGVLTLGTMLMGIYIKSHSDSVKEHRDLIARTREEVREKYVHKNEMQVVVESLNSRFDRIEEKIDKIIGKA
jgi:Tfp pilus assembly protein PilO